VKKKKFFLGCSTPEKIFTDVHRVFLETFRSVQSDILGRKLRIDIEK
jgi:hypothetical protein